MGTDRWMRLTLAGAVFTLLLFALPTCAAGGPVRSPLAVVDSVKENSAAAKSGLRAGDIITAIHGKRAPALDEVLAARFDGEGTRDTAITLKRGRELVNAVIPQGGWDCTLRPDFAEAPIRRLARARDEIAGDGSSRGGQEDWERLARETARAGFPEAALWLRLELADTLLRLRRWSDAEKACEDLGRLAGERSFWRFSATLRLAEALKGAGEYGRAAQFYETGRALAGESGSELRLAKVLTRWADFEWRRGRLPEAEGLAERAHSSLKRLAPESLDMAVTLTLLGNVSWSRGHLPEARELHLGALEIRRRLAPESLAVAASLNNLGLLAQEQDQLGTAWDYHLRSLAMKERLAPGSLDVAFSLNNLGIVAWKQGDLAAAHDFQRMALEIRERLDPGSLQVAASLDNLGYIADDRGDLGAAEEFFRRALAIQERLAPGSTDESWSLLGLGNTAHDRRDLAGAKTYFLKVLAIRERLAPDGGETAWSLVGLGNVASEEGDWAGARAYYLRALAVQERLAPESLGVASSLNNLGLVAQAQGDPDAAKTYHLRALALLATLAPDGMQAAMSRHALGEVALAQGDLAGAREMYLKSLAVRERLAPGSYAVAETLRGLAGVEGASKNITGRTDLLARAVSALESQRGKAGGETAKSVFSAAHGAFYTDLMDSYLDAGRPEMAMETLERSRARALLEMVSSRFVDLRGEVPESLLARRRDLALRRKSLTDKLSQSDAKTDPAEVEALRSRLLTLPEEEDALAEEIRKASPRLAALEYTQPLDYGGIVSALPPESLLLAFAVAEEETLLFALFKPRQGPATLRASRLPIGRNELGVRVRAFRALLGPDAASGLYPWAWEAFGRSLYRILLASASPEIAACRRILVLPDGALHLLPFAALVPSDKRLPEGLNAIPLGLQRPISVEASLTVYSELKARATEGPAARGASWVGFGDPTYRRGQESGEFRGDSARPGARGGDLSPLPGTRREIEAISALFGGKATALLGPEATEEAARKLPKETEYLHFACHGLLDPTFPMNSALALTLPPPPEPGDTDAVGHDLVDGLLQAWEIIQDVRLDTECVVLSACDTGSGKVLGGEGVLGLTRAFFYAGVRSAVVSLWPISDESTVFIMNAFYEEVLKGTSRDLALSRAQAKLAFGEGGFTPLRRAAAPHQRSARSPRAPAFTHPFYWAAFVFHGSGGD